MGAVIDDPGVLYAFTVTPEKTYRIYLSYPRPRDTQNVPLVSQSALCVPLSSGPQIDYELRCRFFPMPLAHQKTR